MEQRIINFYEAFNRLDAEEMVAQYHDDIQFEDPAFGILEGERAKNMWRMLCESQTGKDFQVTYSDVKYENSVGHAHWEAQYFFSRTGRKVHNRIDTSFQFKDGKIFFHKDVFNLYNWAQQALGWQGTLIGWTPYFKKKLNQQTNRLLDKFEQQKSSNR